MASTFHMTDNDFRKGAFEEDNPVDHPQTSMVGQLPHRGGDPEADGLDTDFPEPGQNPEHSGEPQENVAPGPRQKPNPPGKDDPKAA